MTGVQQLKPGTHYPYLRPIYTGSVYRALSLVHIRQYVNLLRHVRREWALLSFHSVCLSVWVTVGHSATYSLPRLIDHNQIWSAGIYLFSDRCKPFWIPYLPYFRCQREKYAKFRLLRILATVNVTHRAIWLVDKFVVHCASFPENAKWLLRCGLLQVKINVHCVSKNVLTLKRYSSKLQGAILMKFGRNIQNTLE